MSLATWGLRATHSFIRSFHGRPCNSVSGFLAARIAGMGGVSVIEGVDSISVNLPSILRTVTVMRLTEDLAKRDRGNAAV
jgi:hypothetical protein